MSELVMSIVETVTVFVGLPALVIAVVAGLVYLSGARSSRRYRPGRPFEFSPVWFLSSPEVVNTGTPHTDGHPAIESGAAQERAESSAGVKGGARGSW
ncbi:MAG TPA: hypothetical protein VFZ32_09220 [Micromonosporaceae bacterium]